MIFFLENIFKDIDGNLNELKFGFIHVSVMLIGFYTGFSISRFLKIVSYGYVAGIFCEDLITSYLDSHRWSAICIVMGGLIPLIFIAILGKFFEKSDFHINTGDQENVKKRFRLLLKCEFKLG